ncbi:MAG: hypothetical protein K0R12_975 [Gammaproteobacteria bacterium]|jgi:diguanylate cyclase (GGDEF)-like protein|nr:hypothetical protein [Gammaproteobacteria bacterium]
MPSILHIEDSLVYARLIRAYLEEESQETQLTHITCLAELPAVLKDNHFQAILLDLGLPDSQGMHTFHAVHAYFPDLPVIVISGNEDDPLSIEAVQSGAQEYLVKQHLNAHILMRTIQHAIERNRLTVALLELQKHQQYLATHDTLTELPNRQLLYDRLSQIFERSKRNQEQFAVLLLDLDNFKSVNDSYGHAYGDAILKEAANRITKSVRDMDTVARLGGDEFTIILTQLSHSKDTEQIAKNILMVLQQPFQIDSHSLSIHASIGIAVYPDDGDNIDLLLHHADLAMYQAKKVKHSYSFFKAKKNTHAYKQLSLITSLKHAIERDEFRLYFQPQIDVLTNKPVAVEALLRWQHPQFGFLPPNEFLSLAEETGLIVPIGEWVIFHAASQLRLWQENGIDNIRIAINLSGRQFEQPNVIHRIASLVAASQIKASDIDIELTESTLMRNPQETARVLAQLREMGMTISIDDFGTAYSSLNYLKRFPVNTLKIDKSFTAGITVDQNDAQIVNAILALAKSLSLNVVAEGIETEEQKMLLQQQGCHIMQGHLFMRPMQPEACEAFLKDPE